MNLGEAFSQHVEGSQVPPQAPVAPISCAESLIAVDSGCLASLGDHFSTVSAQPNLAVTDIAPSSVRQDRLQRKRAAQRDAVPDSGKAASYARFSSDMQRAESNTDQQRICREAADRNNHIISSEREYADEGVSGTKRKREGLKEVLEAAERGEFSTLYLYSLSRLARESIITLPLLKLLAFKFKVRVISVSDGIDTNVTNWELIAAIMSFVSEQYLRDLKAGVLRGQEGIVLALLCVGDYCFGYSSEPIPGTENSRRGRNARPRKMYVICIETAVWVDRIFFWFVVENWSISAIARELTRLGVPKDHRSTNPVWSTSNVRSVLENDKYIGRWPWGTMTNVRDPETGIIHQELRDEAETEKWTRQFPHLRLLPDERFEAAQQKLRHNSDGCAKSRAKKGRLCGSTGDRRGQLLLSGLIECGGCGSKFVCAGKRLYCPNHPKGQCPCATGLNRELAERLILNQVGSIIQQTPEWLDELEAALVQANALRQQRAPTEAAALRRQLSDVESRRDNLLLLAESGEADPDLTRRLAERRREARDLRDRLRQLESHQCVSVVAPTRESLIADLQNLAERVHGSEAAAGEALRQLLGGKILVEEVTQIGSSRKYLRGTLRLRVYDVSQAIGREAGMDEIEAPEVISRVIDFFDPDIQAEAGSLRERAWLMYKEGRLAKEISAELEINRNRVADLLQEAAAVHGENLVDGRTRRATLSMKHLEQPLFQAIAPRVMELFDGGELYATIASTLKVDINTIRKSVTWWHECRGLQAPDGRSRRLELEVKSRK